MSEPIHIISLGAGVQSSTMALMAAKGEIAPMPVAAIFADTQCEPKGVYDWLRWLKSQLPFPVHEISAGNLGEILTASRERKDGCGMWQKSSLPAYTANYDGSKGHMPRGCTYDFKVIPLTRMQRKLGNVKRGEKFVRVISWQGISTDEASRMKDSREKWVQHRWPLIELGMSRQNCLTWMKVNGFVSPPKSACYFCPFHSDTQWRFLKENDPNSFKKAVEFELKFQKARSCTKDVRGIPYLHASRKPLSEVDFSTEEERGQLNMFNNECEGMCGV